METELKELYVRITKSSESFYWYANLVGKVYCVTKDSDYWNSGTYLLADRTGCIVKEDCEEVKDKSTYHSVD